MEIDYPTRDWKEIKILGKGAYGQVSLWTNTASGQSVAIKKCSVELNKLGADERRKLKSRWELELQWMRQLNTENIVRACPDLCPELSAKLDLPGLLPVIIMEYCDGGNLRTHLQNLKNINGLGESDVRQVLSALSNAISYLHNHHQITHRDIKPDNIVIKTGDGGKPIYKLTDMGYARNIDQNTVLGSMVGSRNYFAPEIVETAEYKNSVDYWSMGIVAFEIICGVYPFLPDGTMFEILKSVKEKPSECVAITKSNDNKLCHHTELFPENLLSTVFRTKINLWLRLALETDGRKRGYKNTAPDDVQRLSQTQLAFFAELEMALKSKVFTVFYLNRHQFLSYDIDESTTTTTSIVNKILQDTETEELGKLHFVFPAGHKLSSFTVDVQPEQLYEEKFASEDKPMCYLIKLEDENICGDTKPFISESVLSLFKGVKQLEKRILKQCLHNALFVHHNVQREVAEFANGLHEYALMLETDIMAKERCCEESDNRIKELQGRVAQHQMMMALGKQLLNERQIPFENLCNNEWVTAHPTNSSNIKCQQNLLCAIREHIKNSQLSTYLEPLKRHVEKFERAFEEVCTGRCTITEADILSSTGTLIKLRYDFFKESKIQSEANALAVIHTGYMNMVQNLNTCERFWSEWQERLAHGTKAYLLSFGEMLSKRSPIDNLVEDMDTLDIASDASDSQKQVNELRGWIDRIHADFLNTTS